ncbi:MAG: flagellar protein FlgN [Ignavibacteriae bacterium]|nr:flagellar protein FlgN [Ignavibacteriota bacterium]
MSLQKLMDVLDNQEKNLNKLLSVATKKQKTLLDNNNEKLNEAITLEEKQLLKVQTTEEQRLNIMEKLFAEYSISNERYKLSILVVALRGKVSEVILKKIGSYEALIKNIIEKISKVNTQNILLIEQSRQIINETIKAVVSSSNRSIVDRKG